MDYTVEHEGRVFAAMTKEQLQARGVPMPVIEEAESNARSSAVSSECRRRIYAAASAEAQMNMATAAAIISGKPETDRTEDENAILAGVGAALDWVTDMRGNVDLLTMGADDFLKDTAWPEVPVEALAAIRRY